MERQAITGTYVLAERTFACKHAIEGDLMLRLDLTMSLDGYVAGPDQTLEEPLGAGGMRLHEWVFGLESWRRRHGLEGGEMTRDSDGLEEALAATGAVLMGRRMFSGGAGPLAGAPKRY